jgi:sugar lactone lactonase YvrE
MQIETLLWGYTLPEAPRVDNAGNLYFSDGLGAGGVHRLSSSGEVTTLVSGRKLVGGLVLHRAGGFIMAGQEMAHWNDGLTRTLLQLEGVYYFNDIHTDKQGAVYVGAIRTNMEELVARNQGRAWDVKETQKLITPGHCYRINLDGSVDELYGDINVGNGIGFSPDYRTLYHVDSFGPYIVAHDVDESGAISNRRHIGQASFRAGIPDGLSVDAEGTLWVGHVNGGRVVRLSPTGDELGEIKLPATRVNTITFGGPDFGDMYICAADNLDDPSRRGTIFRTRPGVCGIQTPLAAV